MLVFAVRFFVFIIVLNTSFTPISNFVTFNGNMSNSTVRGELRQIFVPIFLDSLRTSHMHSCILRHTKGL